MVGRAAAPDRVLVLPHSIQAFRTSQTKKHLPPRALGWSPKSEAPCSSTNSSWHEHGGPTFGGDSGQIHPFASNAGQDVTLVAVSKTKPDADLLKATTGHATLAKTACRNSPAKPSGFQRRSVAHDWPRPNQQDQGLSPLRAPRPWGGSSESAGCHAKSGQTGPSNQPSASSPHC